MGRGKKRVRESKRRLEYKGAGREPMRYSLIKINYLKATNFLSRFKHAYTHIHTYRDVSTHKHTQVQALK